MDTVSNTPPDGDFVRYLERLTTGDLSVVAVPQVMGEGSAKRRQPQMVHQKADVAGHEPLQAQPVQSVQPAPDSGAAQVAIERLAVHMKSAAAILIVTQILGVLIPGMGYLLLPALAAYVWYVSKTRPADRRIGSALMQRFRDLAAQQESSRQIERQKPTPQQKSRIRTGNFEKK